jgi:uncharacterized protein (TIRG00374 family)
MASFSISKGLIFRLIISALMIGLVLNFTDFDKLIQVFRSIPLPVVLAVIAGYLICPFLNCYRWMLFARSAGVEATYPQALRAYFVGAFVNAFGLGTVGGDLTRALMLAGDKPVKAASLASVAADRLHGLAMLALIGSLSALFADVQHLHPDFLALLSLIAPAIIIGWFFGPWIIERALIIDLCLRFNLEKIRLKIKQAFGAFPRDRSIMIFVSFLSLCFHLAQISLHLLMASALNVEIPLLVLLVVVPFVNIVSSLPISWMGLGVRENAYIFFLVPLFLSREQAVAFGAIWLLAVTVTSAMGGLVSVFGIKSSDSSESQKIGNRHTR